MAYFAKVEDGIVTKVISAEADYIMLLPQPETWIETSARTRGNIHYGPDGQPDGQPALRGNFAGIGFIYDKQNDVFYPQPPYPGAQLDPKTWTWSQIGKTIF